MKQIETWLLEYDSLRQTAGSDALERWLTEKCRLCDALQAEDPAGCAALYNELGSFYRGEGEYKKGEKAYLQAKKLLETAVAAGFAHPLDYATTVNNLAGLCRLDKRFEQAFALFGEALELYRAAGDTPQPILASCHNNRGLVYVDLRRYEEAMAEFDTAMTILNGSTGADYELATTFGNRSVALAGLGRLREACDSMREAAQRYKVLLGEAHPTHQGCLRFIAALEQALQAKGDAE